MSLTAMLAAHDDAALAALASPGLVRRAARDAAAGKARVVRRDEERAEVDADGQNVILPAGGPKAATCPCHATGLCRHVLLALITLRDAEVEAETQDAPVTDAGSELEALSEDDIRAFAGADMDAALVIAAAGDAADMAQSGPNLTITLEAHPDPVTFIAGQGLRGAVFKGPRTRKRRAVTAAAILARRLRGVAPPPVTEGRDGALDADFLDRCAETLTDAARSVLTGTPALARDRLFDLSISARAGAAPRLASALRALAAETRLAEAHHVAFDEAEYLAALARTAALVAALRNAPGDIALTGSLRRDYAQASACTVWIAGAVSWQDASGARGMRVHAIDLENRRWLVGGSARAAGMDPGFTPNAAYHGALWGAGIAGELVGRRLRIDAPLISADGLISGRTQATICGETTDLYDKLEARGILHSRRVTLDADLRHRLGTGLRAAATPCPVLLRIGAPRGLHFDDLDQSYIAGVDDAEGATVHLHIPASRTEHALHLDTHMRRGDVLLCEAVQTGPDVRLSPVSLLQAVRGDLRVTNLTFDPLDAEGSRMRKLLRTLTRSGHGGGTVVATDPLAVLAQQALDASVAAIAYGSSEDARAVAKSGADLGLDRIAVAATSVADQPDSPQALRLAYLAAELRRLVAQGILA